MKSTYSTLITLLLINLLFYSLLMSHTCAAIELSADVFEQQIKMQVTNINYPEQVLVKQLNSGLTNNISTLLSLQQDNKTVFATKINYKITYDLWDEVYQLVITNSFGEPVSKVIDNKEQLLIMLNQLDFSSHEAFMQLQPQKRYQVKVQILVNPVASERINKIRAWIATSQGYSLDPEQSQHNKAAPVTQKFIGNLGANDQGISVIRSSARPRFQKLFDQLLEQHLASADTPALWRSDVASINISLVSSINEK